MITVYFNTEPECSIQIPDDTPIPEVGQDFYFPFEDYSTNPQEWELIQSSLENDVPVVAYIHQDKVFLSEGSLHYWKPSDYLRSLLSHD